MSPSAWASAPTSASSGTPGSSTARMTGWGQDGPVRPHRGARHQLHRSGRGARTPGTHRREADPADQPGRRLRWWGDAAGLRRGLRAARGPALGQGPGGRRRHGRRLGDADDDDLGVQGDGHLDEDRGTNMLDTGAHFYDTYETSDGLYRLDRLDRAAVLRRAAQPHRARGAPGRQGTELPHQMDRAHWGELKERPGRDLRHQDPRRVVRDHGGHRRLLRPRSHHERGGAASPQRRAGGPSSSIAGITQPAPSPRFSRTPGRSSAHRRIRASTPMRCSAIGSTQTPPPWTSCATAARSPEPRRGRRCVAGRDGATAQAAAPSPFIRAFSSPSLPKSRSRQVSSI